MKKKKTTSSREKNMRLNARQEMFAIEVANGVCAAEAYRIVYGQGNMSDDTLYSTSSRLRNSVKVDARIREILNERARNSVADRKRCNEALMNIVNANPKRLMYTDSKSGKSRMRNPQQLGDDTADAISDMTNNKGYVHYRFHGKIEAIRLLAQINGWDAPTEVNINSNGGNGVFRFGFEKQDD